MRALLRHILLLAVLVPACARAAETPRPFVFGINANTSHRALQAAVAAGCTNVRIGCGWDLIEQSPGIYDFRSPDNDVAMCEQYGLEPFFLIVATPRWALAPDKRDKPFGHCTAHRLILQRAWAGDQEQPGGVEQHSASLREDVSGAK